jgi:hypothetical protein
MSSKGPYGSSVRLEGIILRPIPKESSVITPCTTCRTEAARWETGPRRSPSMTCSRCVLYRMSTLKKQRQTIDGLIARTEIRLGRNFARSDTGELIRAEDIDRFVAAIVAAERIASMRSRQ